MPTMLDKVLRCFSVAWFTLAGLLIFISMIAIWYTEGFDRVREVFSPFNIINFGAALITFAPGIGTNMLANRIEQSQKIKINERIPS
jgi:hypothetical protein